MFEKILVCLDGSKPAELVLDHVVKEAQTFGSKVTLLRVISPPAPIIPLNLPGMPGGAMRIETSMKRKGPEEHEATEYLKGMAAQLAGKGLAAEPLVLSGTPGDTIVAYARENDFRLIALGTHGHSGFRRLALGSTAEFVLHHTRIPVLIVNPGA